MKNKRTFTISEKFQLGTAVSAFVLMLGVYLMKVMNMRGWYDWPDVLVSETIFHVIDMIPFVLLLVCSIRQKSGEYRYSRSFPLMVLASRCIVDLAGIIFRETGVTYELTFDMLLEYCFGAVFTLLLIVTAAAAMMSRQSYLYTSAIFGGMYLISITLTLSDSWEYSHLRMVWGLAYVLLHVSLFLLGVTLTDENMYCPKLHRVLDRVLDELLTEEEETDGKYDAPEVYYDVLGTIDGYSAENPLQPSRYILVHTPEDETLILVKRAESGRYEIVDDYEEEKEVLGAYFHLIRQEPADNAESDEREENE